MYTKSSKSKSKSSIKELEVRIKKKLEKPRRICKIIGRKDPIKRQISLSNTKILAF